MGHQIVVLNFCFAYLVPCRSMLARDLQSIVLYDQDGKFVGVRRPSSKLPIEINGNEILIEDAIGSTGLDLKVRPSDSLFQILHLKTIELIWYW